MSQFKEAKTSNKRADVILRFLSNRIDQRIPIIEFKKYLQYYDVYCNSLKILLDAMISGQVVQNEIYQQNVFLILQHFTQAKSSHAESKRFLLKNKKDDSSYLETLAENFKLFDKVWFEFISWNLNPTLHRKVLLYLPENVFPNMDNPLVFTDFYMRAFSCEDKNKYVVPQPTIN